MKPTKTHFRMLLASWLLSLGMAAYGQNTIPVSLVKWSFRTQTGLLCDLAKDAGVEALELVGPDKWDVIQEKGLSVALADGADLGIERGFCNRKWHKQLIENYSQLIPRLAERGIRQIVCYSGVNTELTAEEAMEVCVEGLMPLLPMAKKANVTLVMELLSSRACEEPFTKQRFLHYQCDSPEWGAALCKKLNSPCFKLLYDVWHMNDMKRDVMTDVKKYHSYISHYHIAGIPGRGGLDKDDAFDYSRFINILSKSGYKGFVGLEPDRIEAALAATIQNSVAILKQ